VRSARKRDGDSGQSGNLIPESQGAEAQNYRKRMTSFERIHPTRATNRESQEQARLGTVNRGSFTGQLTFTEDPSTPIQEVIVK
jgi:hypothetical protein